METLLDYYAQHARDSLPWRQPETDGRFDPYKIMVSELMLQQTQVARVIPKYEAFLERFPNVHQLASVELGEVLRMWQGLGYNRRAKFLWLTSQIVDKLKYFPGTEIELVKLPGIGKNTAGAILAYAYNRPVIFIETNVRTVYIHHFFADQIGVADTEIAVLLQQTMDQENPRQFYWALMDYGSHLKATIGNANKASKHYTKQSTFQGSARQIRGQVIRRLGQQTMTETELMAELHDERLLRILSELVHERLIRKNGSTYSL